MWTYIVCKEVEKCTHKYRLEKIQLLLYLPVLRKRATQRKVGSRKNTGRLGFQSILAPH